MRRLVTIAEVRSALRAARAGERQVGFVPTMGALHAGHLALVRASLAECDVTVVSIFVNPAEFGPGMDLERYPRDLAGDEAKLAPLGVDFTFAPAVEELYPPGFATWVEVEGLTELLDGASRPGYFRGVCTVVAKLFQIVRPDVAFFGQKEIQQAVVVRRLARDLDLGVDVRIEETVRAADGLALSSRNAHLAPADRALAQAPYRALVDARGLFEAGERDARVLVARARDGLARTPELAVDYVEVVSLASMQRLERVGGPGPRRAGRARRVGLVQGSWLAKTPSRTRAWKWRLRLSALPKRCAATTAPERPRATPAREHGRHVSQPSSVRTRMRRTAAHSGAS